jgi:hypothetical protein
LPNFPISVDSLANPTATTRRNDVGFELHAVISTLNDIAEAVESKVGITDTPGVDVPAANTVLASSATGKSSWRKVKAADIDTTTRLAQSGHADGVTAGPTATSGIYVAMPDMSVTLTTTGGDLIAVFDGAFSINTSGQSIFIALRLDAGADVADNTHNFQHTAQPVAVGTNYRWSGVAAGSHTVTARWQVTGTAQITATSTYRRLTVHEVK